MILPELAEFLEGEGLGLTRATNLFIGELPEKATDIVSMVYALSPTPDKALDLYIQDVDFWSRYQDASEGYVILSEIQDILHKAAHWDLDSWHIYFSFSTGAVDDFGRDNQRNKLHKLTIRFIYRPTDQYS